MSPKKAMRANEPVVRTFHLHNGKKIKGVVGAVVRPAVLICELENGKTVEVLERMVQQIDPPLNESIQEEG